MGSPTKFRFPQGVSRSYLLRFFAVDGTRQNITGATFAAYIKRSMFDADADALVNISARVAVSTGELGEATLSLIPADTSALDAFAAKELQVRATLPDTTVLEQHYGPLVFEPLAGDPAIPEPPTESVDGISDMSGFLRVLTEITGLTGGAATALDALSAATLAALANGARAVLTLTAADGEKIRAEYQLSDLGADVEAAPWIVVCDAAPTRCWRLDRGSVSKAGQPCTYNATTQKWYRVWSTGAAGVETLAQDANAQAFVFPA